MEHATDDKIYVENRRADDNEDDNACNDADANVTNNVDDAAREDFPVNEEPDVRRGPGRPKVVRTGQRGCPRKQYNQVAQCVESELAEQVFLSEVPMRRPLAGPDSE